MPATTNAREYEPLGAPIKAFDAARIRSYSAHPIPYDYDVVVDELMRTVAKAKRGRVTSDPPSVDINYPVLVTATNQVLDDVVSDAIATLVALSVHAENDDNEADAFGREKAAGVAIVRADSPLQGLISTTPLSVDDSGFTVVRRNHPRSKKRSKRNKGEERQLNANAPDAQAGATTPTIRSNNPFRPLRASSPQELEKPDSGPLEDGEDDLEEPVVRFDMNAARSPDDTERTVNFSLPDTPHEFSKPDSGPFKDVEDELEELAVRFDMNAARSPNDTERPADSSVPDSPQELEKLDSGPLEDVVNEPEDSVARFDTNAVKSPDDIEHPVDSLVTKSPVDVDTSVSTAAQVSPPVQSRKGKKSKRRKAKKSKAKDESNANTVLAETEQIPSSPETVQGAVIPASNVAPPTAIERFLARELTTVRRVYIALGLDPDDLTKRPPPPPRPYKNPEFVNACFGCRRTETELGYRLTKICSRCTLYDPYVRYCDEDCQRLDWQEHRVYCGGVIFVKNGSVQQLMPARMNSKHWETAAQKVNHTWDVFTKIGDQFQTMKMVVDASRLLNEASQQHFPGHPFNDPYCDRPQYDAAILKGYKFKELQSFLDKTLSGDALDNYMPIWWTREKRDECELLARTLYQWDDLEVSPPIPHEIEYSNQRYGGPGVRGALLYVAVRISSGVRISPMHPWTGADGSAPWPAVAMVGQKTWTRKPASDVWLDTLFAMDVWERLPTSQWLGLRQPYESHSIHEIAPEFLEDPSWGFKLEFEDVCDEEGAVIGVDPWVKAAPLVWDENDKCCEQGSVDVLAGEF